MSLFAKISKKIVLRLIGFYQLTLSPDHGPLRALWPNGVCRFEETCSSYTKKMVEQDGFFGLWLGLKRVSRCHPFAK